MGEAAGVAMRTVKDAHGLEEARVIYGQLLKLPPVGGSFMHAIIDMELDLCSSPERLSDAQLQRMFEVSTRPVACCLSAE